MHDRLSETDTLKSRNSELEKLLQKYSETMSIQKEKMKFIQAENDFMSASLDRYEKEVTEQEKFYVGSNFYKHLFTRKNVSNKC